MITKDLPTLEQLQNGTFTFWLCQELSDGTKEETSYSGVTAITQDENNILWLFAPGNTFKQSSSSPSSGPIGLVCFEDNFTIGELTIPEKGVYVVYYENSGGGK